MKATDEEIRSWIRREQGKKKPSQIYINWLRKQVQVTVSATVKREKVNEKN